MAPSASTGAGGDTARPSLNPLDLIVCQRCRVDFSSEPGATPFFVTTCSHVVCGDCLLPKNHLEAPPQPDDFLTCPRCNADCRVMLLDQNSQEFQSLRHCFRPLRDLVDEASMAFNFQQEVLLEQLNFFRDKVIAQRQVLQQLATQLKEHKKSKVMIEKLQRENASLRAQLTAALMANATSGSSDSHRAAPDEDRTRKRKASDEEPEQSYRRAPQNDPGPTRHAATTLPLQPARLSLSPAHASSHGPKQLQGNVRKASASGTGGGFIERPPSRTQQIGDAMPPPTPRKSTAEPSRQASRQQTRQAQLQPDDFHQSQSQQQPAYHDAIPSSNFPPRQLRSNDSYLDEQVHYHDPQDQQQAQFDSGSYHPTPVGTPMYPDSSQHSMGGQRVPFAPSHASSRAVDRTEVFTSSNQPYLLAPTPTPQRQIFQPHQEQLLPPSNYRSGGGSSTPRPSLDSFAYRDPNARRRSGGEIDQWRGGGGGGGSSRVQFR